MSIFAMEGQIANTYSSCQRSSACQGRKEQRQRHFASLAENGVERRPPDVARGATDRRIYQPAALGNLAGRLILAHHPAPRTSSLTHAFNLG
jgi:hypothetical protein